MTGSEIALKMSLAGAAGVSAGISQVSGALSKLKVGLAAVGVVAGVAKLAQLAKNAIDVADNAAQMAQKVGVAVERLTALQYAANLADVSTSELQSAFKNYAEELQKSGRSSADFYDELLKVADEFAAMPDGIEKATKAQQLFGRSGLEMIPLLNQGSEAIKKQAEEAKALGVVVGPTFGRNADQFNDNMSKVESLVKGVFLQTMERALPTINAVVTALIEWAKSSGISGVAVQNLTTAVVSLAESALLASEAWITFNGILEGKGFGEIGAELLALERRIQELRDGFSSPINTDGIKEPIGAMSRELTKLEIEIRRMRMSDVDQAIKAEQDKLDARNAAIAATVAAEDQKVKALELSQAVYIKNVKDIEAAALQEKLRMHQQYASSAAGVFGDIATAAKAFGAKGFKIWKAFATAQAIGDTYKSAVGAFSAFASIPYVGPFLGAAAAAAAVAAGLANVAQIQSAQPAGFMYGGYTGSGPRNEVAGQVHRGEYVIDAPRVQRIGIDNLDALGRAPNVSVGGARIVNVTVRDQAELRDYMKSAAGQDVIINVIKNNRLSAGIS